MSGKVVGVAMGLFWLWVLCMGLYIIVGPAAVIVPAILAALVTTIVITIAITRSGRVARTAAAVQAERNKWLAGFPSATHKALARLAWDAPGLWAPMGMGRTAGWVGSGAKAVWDPGTGPALTSAVKTDLGARITLRMLDGHSVRHYLDRRGQMSNALNVTAVRVVSDQGHEVTLELVVNNPLDGMFVSPLIDNATADRITAVAKTELTDDERARQLTVICRDMQLTHPPDSISCFDDIFCGPSESGEPIVVNLAAGAHGAVQGASRSGKSIFLNTLLAYGSLARDVRVVIIDPNTAAVAPWWRTAYLVCNSTDPAEATAVLRQVNTELRARESEFWRLRTDRITNFSPTMPMYLVVVDEVSEYAKSKEFQAELSRAGAQLAKYGGRLIPSGQKLGEDSISTTTRANLFDRFCFRVESRHDMAHLFENTPDLEAKGLTAVSETMPQGTAIVRTRAHKETTRMRAVYLPTEACWAISDQIVAHRGAMRALPGQPALPPASDPAAITAKNIPLVLPAAATGTTTDNNATAITQRNLPTVPPATPEPLPRKRFGTDRFRRVRSDGGTVVPFDRTRPDTTEDDPDATPSTGTE